MNEHNKYLKVENLAKLYGLTREDLLNRMADAVIKSMDRAHKEYKAEIKAKITSTEPPHAP